jgi:hypothetical protein
MGRVRVARRWPALTSDQQEEPGRPRRPWTRWRRSEPAASPAERPRRPLGPPPADPVGIHDRRDAQGQENSSVQIHAQVRWLLGGGPAPVRSGCAACGHGGMAGTGCLPAGTRGSRWSVHGFTSPCPGRPSGCGYQPAVLLMALPLSSDGPRNRAQPCPLSIQGRLTAPARSTQSVASSKDAQSTSAPTGTFGLQNRSEPAPVPRSWDLPPREQMRAGRTGIIGARGCPGGFLGQPTQRQRRSRGR